MPRLDVLVAERNFAPSRQRAKMLILNGQILVDGIVVSKPSFVPAENAEITLQGSDIPFVGRGGFKLAYVIEQYHLDLRGMVCMDVGASTGGFTDCMLQNGAKKVYAVDVGHGQLAESLRQDSRVLNWEKTDIRHVTLEQLERPLDLASVDVSFISLRIVLPSITALLRQEGMAIVLIKPQFEAGRENIGKNGLVTSPKIHRRVLEQMLQLFADLQLSLRFLSPSPILGGSGNREFLAVLQKTGSPGISVEWDNLF